ncbi:putative leucine-rich repeat domain superfamily [Helianthus annuus]|nr:putative leucine-rich repeat domain superfamily [Helianthus annuus]
MANLRNLVKISFYKFLNCTCLPPLGRLPNLRVIHLMEMNSLKCFHDDDKIMLGDTNMFPRLQELDIGMCSDLVSLPNNLPNLKVLKLEECDKLVFLPDNLPSIRKLYLMRCDGLLSLPDDIQSFKDPNELLINKCRHLSERCKTDISVDWPKISHIPNVHIDPPR